jgi:hypothetical protein
VGGGVRDEGEDCDAETVMEKGRKIRRTWERRTVVDAAVTYQSSTQ